MQKYFMVSMLLLMFGCKQNTTKNEVDGTNTKPKTIRLYSKNVADSFSIFINLPTDYREKDKLHYPVVYLLDANLYFDILATMLNKYIEVGLMPPVILVGVGYKDFPTMDSLRDRDDTYPVAIPEYQMSISGGADKFLSFINTELVPRIDKEYRTDTTKRILMGHSLGGYFTAYAMLSDMLGNSKTFSNYVAASPSLNFNRYYLVDKFRSLDAHDNGRKIKAYFTFGGLEDNEDKDMAGMIPYDTLLTNLSVIMSKHSNNLLYKSAMFSNLAHMDTQYPTFMKGLQWVLDDSK